jgi:hypothetical protein
MNEFPPDRQRGLVLHLILTSVLGLVSLMGVWLTFQTQVGLLFSIYVVIFIFTVIPVPVLGYRAYALTRANYLLDRNTLRLVWGLRVEDIPVTDVEWVRPVKGLPAPIKLPWFRLPGGILGITRSPGIGRVEFLAAEVESLVLVATARQIFAISPENPAAFLNAFQKTIEMGSLQSAQAGSQYPSFVVVQAWKSALVRFLWMAGVFMNTGLLIWVGLVIPSLAKVSLGFTPAATPMEATPGLQLILLPMLSAFLFVAGWLSGLFFFRKPEHRILALALWLSGTVSTLFFLAAVFFILSTPI